MAHPRCNIRVIHTSRIFIINNGPIYTLNCNCSDNSTRIRVLNLTNIDPKSKRKISLFLSHNVRLQHYGGEH